MLSRLTPAPEEFGDRMGRRVLLASLLMGCIVVGSWIVRWATEPAYVQHCSELEERTTSR